jgi:hypothetical protein
MLSNSAIGLQEARERLLFAIEVFDDALVGTTNKSLELGHKADALFARWNGRACQNFCV